MHGHMIIYTEDCTTVCSYTPLPDVWLRRKPPWVAVCAAVCIRICACVYVHVRVRVCVCVCANIHAVHSRNLCAFPTVASHTHTHIHTHVHAHMLTRTHTYTHIHTQHSRSHVCYAEVAPGSNTQGNPVWIPRGWCGHSHHCHVLQQ